MSSGEASDSSPPYTGSPAPFELLVKGIAGWAQGSVTTDENYQWGVGSLVPSTIQEANSISRGYGQAFGMNSGIIVLNASH